MVWRKLNGWLLWQERIARLKGIVAEAPVYNGDEVRPVLEKLVDIQLVKGVRHVLEGESIEFCVQPNFIKGVQMLEEFGFSFDICIRHPQLANTIQMVKQCPNVEFILDHIAKPDIKGTDLRPVEGRIKDAVRISECRLQDFRSSNGSRSRELDSRRYEAVH